MNENNKQIDVVTCLRKVLRSPKSEPSKYALVVRWILGNDDEDQLPHPRDEFEVSISAGESPKDPQMYLGPDGRFRTEKQDPFSVKPRSRVMLDPPRTINPEDCKPDDCSVKNPRRPYAIKPEKSVRCPTLPARRLPKGEGFGVCHLLEGSHKARIQWSANALLKKWFGSAKEELKSKGAIQIAEGSDVQAMAEKWACELARGGLRASDLEVLLAKAHADLVEVHPRLMQGLPKSCGVEIEPFGLDINDYTPEIFQWGDSGSGKSTKDLQLTWERAAIVMKTFSKPGYIEILATSVDDPKQVRQQMRLRALTGGDMLDYWCCGDCDCAQQGQDGCKTCEDEARGKQYPASELIGCGLTVCDVSEDDIKDILYKGYHIYIKVDHIPAKKAQYGPAAFFQEEDGTKYRQGKDMLSRKMIESALTNGTSLPPAPPASAWVNYAFAETNSGPLTSDRKASDPDNQIAQRAIRYSTGDGAVEVSIRIPASANTIAGFNVYMMWEDQGNNEYFESEGRNKPQVTDEEKDDLRRFLVNRQYSYLYDLKCAFPGDGGKQTLERLAKNPPWSPLLRRHPGEYEDKPRYQAYDPEPENNDPPENSVDLPLIWDPNVTQWKFDVRTGMQEEVSPGNKIEGWDPQADPLINFSDTKQDSWPWTPRYNREGKAVTDNKPQGYRIWVSSVDFTDQESEWVPVRTEDDEAKEGESYVFRPRHRAALMPSSKEICLTTDEQDPKSNITVKWKSPRYNPISQDINAASNATNAYVPNSELCAHMVVLRKPLRKPVKPENTPAQITRMADPDPADNVLERPPWKHAIKVLEDEGWERVTKFDQTCIKKEGNGIDWQAHIPKDPGASIETIDTGYAYKVLVGFTIDDKAAPFWSPDVFVKDGKGRTLWSLTYNGTNDNDGTVEPIPISESPQTSEVLPSDEHLIANDHLPRAIYNLSTETFAADIVKPPIALRRDQILINLLNRSFAKTGGGGNDPGSKDSLTPGQRLMINTALGRCKTEKFDDLTHARDILERPFKKPPTEGIRDQAWQPRSQHATVGFRGLQRLKWSYKAFAYNPPANEMAEAVQFGIETVRVPVDRLEAENAATMKLQGVLELDLIKGQYILKPNHSGDLLGLLDQEDDEKTQPPVAFWIALQGNDTTEYAMVASLIGPDSGTLRLNAVLGELDITEKAVDVDVLGFVAQPLIQVDAQYTRDKDKPETYDVLLPVPGGRREAIVWWAGSISAQRKESPLTDKLVVGQSFPNSVEPPPLANVVVRPPRVGEKLNLECHGEWLPLEFVQTQNSPQKVEEQLKLNARLVIEWADPSNAKDIDGIIIERRRQRGIMADPKTMLTDAWENARKIADTPPESEIEESWLNDLEEWLLGKTEISPKPLRDTEQVSHISQKAELCRTGLFDDGNPRFIDYFEDNWGDLNTRPEAAMTGDWVYAYRLSSYNWQVDPTTKKKVALISRPTNWTSYYRPDRSPMTLCPGSPEEVASDLDTPSVEFAFTTLKKPDPNPLVRQRKWHYRVIVERKVYASIQVEPTAVSSECDTRPSHWMRVGDPLLIDAGRVGFVFDHMLDRPSRYDGFCLEYRVLVAQYSTDKEGNMRLIRARGDTDETSVGNDKRTEDETVRVLDPILFTCLDPDAELEQKIVMSIDLDSLVSEK